MDYKKLMLKEITNLNVGSESFVEIYLNDKDYEVNIDPRPAMIVVPGGGYEFCSQREGEPIALRFASEGFNCFVLHYSCFAKYNLPHLELAVLVDYIKKNATDLNIDQERVLMAGFSAGGHLIASYAYLYKEFEELYNFKKDYLKPYSIILGYPVTSMYISTNSHTKEIISGNEEGLIKKLSVIENVDSNYPPTFIFTTKNDACVPTSHSYLLAEALEKNGVYNKLLVFENGSHGGSLFNRNVYNADTDFDSIKQNRTWIEESINFIIKIR